MSDIGGSKFWMDDSMFNPGYYSYGTQDRTRADIMKMASVKRAITNFVKIVTNEDLKVKYSSGKMSFTDGKTVILSADAVREKNFDAAVGLALHEGSHIKLSEFDLLKRLPDLIPDSFFINKGKMLSSRGGPIAVGSDVAKDMEIVNRIKGLMNWIEDRRVDYYIYSTSPGYMTYYKAMYKMYFENPVVDKALVSKSFRKENWDSYKFRIWNLTNPNRDLNALKKLHEIFVKLDLPNINRLKNSRDSLNLAIDIYTIIARTIVEEERKEEEKKKKKEENKKSKKPKIIGYTAKGLPDGIKINKKTGKISGKATETGDFKVIVTAYVSDGTKKRKRTILTCE